MYVQKPSAVLFNEYVLKNNLADYVSFSDGSKNAVREITELLIGVYDNFEEVLKHRIEFSAVYKNYLSSKRQIKTENFTYIQDRIESFSDKE
ncbi:MAG: hypothetical protein KatS3mg027_0984 [Bacteroidia bacterium]|nr:MAG: hypothetical protein KatS3mg027_0984 [Bacteroidia bacterium]